MRRSQRLLDRHNSIQENFQLVSKKFKRTLKREKKDGSSQLMNQANADCSPPNPKPRQRTCSLDILAGLNRQSCSEHLPPYQVESAPITGNDSKDDLTSNSVMKLANQKFGNSDGEQITQPKKGDNAFPEGPASRTICGTSKRRLRGRAQTKPSQAFPRKQTQNGKTLQRGRPRKCADKQLPVVGKKSPTVINLKAPLRLTDFRNMLRIQPIQQHGPTFDNAIDPRFMHLNSVQKSLLPSTYPAHFVHQLSPNTVAMAKPQQSPPYDTGLLTPDPTQPTDMTVRMKESPSTASLPESLRAFFDADDIDEILNTGKPLYPLTLQHLHILALVLNLSVDYLGGLIEKILNLDQRLLDLINQKIGDTTSVMAPQMSPSESSVIGCSQSPVAKRYFSSQCR